MITASPLDSKNASINGNNPVVDNNGNISGLDSVAVTGKLTLAGQAIAFAAAKDAKNPACR
jgi:heparanase